MRWRYFKQNVFFVLVRASALVITLALGGILLYILANGISVISWDFITKPPTDSMTKGGIMPAILGTIYLTIGAIALGLPLGIASAVYLTEYARQGRVIRLIKVGINCLAGVPSVVYGLFGLALFVTWLHMGRSLLAGACTLALLVLPLIISASEEALRQLPRGLREGSLALGATRLQTIRLFSWPKRSYYPA